MYFIGLDYNLPVVLRPDNHYKIRQLCVEAFFFCGALLAYTYCFIYQKTNI